MTLEDEIKQLEDELEGMRAPMQDAHAGFARAAAAWAAEWWPQQAKAVVTAHPERAKEAGVAALSQLKRDVASLLVERADEVALEVIDGEAIKWPHLAPDLEANESKETRSQFWRSPFSPPKSGLGPSRELAQPANDLLARVAKVLVSHGFPAGRSGSQYGTYPGNEYHQPWSPDMLAAAERYGALHHKLRETRTSLKKARHALDTRDAAALWDAAEGLDAA